MSLDSVSSATNDAVMPVLVGPCHWFELLSVSTRQIRRNVPIDPLLVTTIIGPSMKGTARLPGVSPVVSVARASSTRANAVRM